MADRLLCFLHWIACGVLGTLSANGLNNRLRRISEVVGAGQGDIKKGLKIEFIGEEGVDAGGLRKEWFLLLIREVFDEAHGA